jgi:hypothetical protein
MFLSNKRGVREKVCLLLLIGLLLTLIGGALCGPGHDIHLAATALAISWHCHYQVQDHSPHYDLAVSVPFDVFQIEPLCLSAWTEQAQNPFQTLAGVLRLSPSRAPPA